MPRSRLCHSRRNVRGLKNPPPSKVSLIYYRPVSTQQYFTLELKTDSFIVLQLLVPSCWLCPMIHVILSSTLERHRVSMIYP